MKKTYVSPELEKIGFECVEVLTSSFTLDVEDTNLPNPRNLDQA